MYMYDFKYERPTSLAEASKLAKAGGKPLAGGQTLLASMKQRLSAPEQLVDLGRIPELVGISKEGNGVKIGAMTKHVDVVNSKDVQATIPALAKLASHIGDRQVRAMGTIGGSLANNDPAADYPAAALALNATFHTDSRDIKADDYFQGTFTTALQEGELIKAISFPAAKKAAYEKFVQPASRFALVGVFVAQTDSGVRVAVTGAGDGVFRHKGLEDALNASFTPEAAEKVKVDASTLNGDIHATAEYRAHLISVLAARAVAKAG